MMTITDSHGAWLGYVCDGCGSEIEGYLHGTRKPGDDRCRDCARF